MNSVAIISELDELEALFFQCRSVFPTLPKELIGHCEFSTAPYYLKRGYAAYIQLQNPINAEFIERNRKLARWINENAVIRLYGIMHYHGYLEKIDQTLPGWQTVDLMRRLRDAFTKTPLGYRPRDPRNVKLRERVIEYFGLDRELSVAGEEIPTSIDTVIEPIFKGCRQYIDAESAVHGNGNFNDSADECV